MLLYILLFSFKLFLVLRLLLFSFSFFFLFDNNNKNYVTDKITNKNNIKNKSVDEKNKNLKGDNFIQKFEQFNRINVNDLDSLYFNDKVNNLKCYNSQKNYDKVPKIKLNKK